MRCITRTFLTVLLVYAALAGREALGQTLSISKQGDTNYWLQATALASDPHSLQASDNLHLWADVVSVVQGHYSYQLDGAAVSQRYFRLPPTPPEAPPIRVMFLGDSMASDCCGWGQGMYGYFKPNATIINYATAGASTKSFLRSAEYDKMVLVKPDYVLIQFGNVDQAWGPDLAPDYYTTPAEFAENLRTISKIVRGWNGVPILVTVHSARIWDADGKIIPSFQERNAVTKQVAKEIQAPLVDLNELSRVLFNELGPSCEAWMHHPDFPANDLLHMSPLGAKYVAQRLVNALPDSFGPYLIGLFDPPPKP
jgi:lysophospholipase L1-like esterase